jgi:hypothetical protein
MPSPDAGRKTAEEKAARAGRGRRVRRRGRKGNRSPRRHAMASGRARSAKSERNATRRREHDPAHSPGHAMRAGLARRHHGRVRRGGFNRGLIHFAREKRTRPRWAPAWSGPLRRTLALQAMPPILPRRVLHGQRAGKCEHGQRQPQREGMRIHRSGSPGLGVWREVVAREGPARRRSPATKPRQRAGGCSGIPRSPPPPAGKCRHRRRPCRELRCVYGFRPGRTAQSMLRDTGSGYQGRDANMLHRTIAPSCAGGLPDAVSRWAGRRMRPVGHVRADHRNKAPSP